MGIRNDILKRILISYGGQPEETNRNSYLLKILTILGGNHQAVLNRNYLLSEILEQLGGTAPSSATRNQLLRLIVTASGGTITNPGDRNRLLLDWLHEAIPPISPGAIKDYYLANNDTAQALIDRVGGIDTLVNTRGTVLNALQTSTNSFLAYPANNQAFDVGRAGIIETARTNLCNAFNVAPTDLTGVVYSSGTAALSLASMASEGIEASIFSIPGDNGNIFKVDNTGQPGVARYRISLPIGSTNSAVMTLAGFSVVSQSKMGLTSDASVGSTLIPFTPSIVSSAAFTPASVADEMFLEVPAGAILYFKYQQLESSTSPTSIIETLGSSSQRDSDTTQIPTTGLPVNNIEYRADFYHAAFDPPGSCVIFAEYADPDNDFIVFNNGISPDTITLRRRISGSNNNIIITMDDGLNMGDRITVSVYFLDSGSSIHVTNSTTGEFKQGSNTISDDIMHASVVNLAASPGRNACSRDLVRFQILNAST